VPKDIFIFPGDHNSVRCGDWTNRSCEFLEACFQAAHIQAQHRGLARRFLSSVVSVACLRRWRASGDYVGSGGGSPADHGESISRGSGSEVVWDDHLFLRFRRQRPAREVRGGGKEQGKRTWPSSRATPEPIDGERYCNWLLRPSRPQPVTSILPPLYRSPPKGVLQAGCKGAGRWVEDSVLSPVVNLIGAVASLWGPASPPPCGMEARLPPRYKTHENVYRSPLLSAAPPSAPSVPAPHSAWTGGAGKDGQTLGSFKGMKRAAINSRASRPPPPNMVWLSKGDWQTWVGGVSGGDLQDSSHSSHCHSSSRSSHCHSYRHSSHCHSSCSTALSLSPSLSPSLAPTPGHCVRDWETRFEWSVELGQDHATGGMVRVWTMCLVLLLLALPAFFFHPHLNVLYTYH